MDACGQVSALLGDVQYPMPTSAIVASVVLSKVTAGPRGPRGHELVPGLCGYGGGGGRRSPWAPAAALPFAPLHLHRGPSPHRRHRLRAWERVGSRPSVGLTGSRPSASSSASQTRRIRAASSSCGSAAGARSDPSRRPRPARRN
jgi:hypothetical protein